MEHTHKCLRTGSDTCNVNISFITLSLQQHLLCCVTLCPYYDQYLSLLAYHCRDIRPQCLPVQQLFQQLLNHIHCTGHHCSHAQNPQCQPTCASHPVDLLNNVPVLVVHSSRTLPLCCLTKDPEPAAVNRHGKNAR